MTRRAPRSTDATTRSSPATRCGRSSRTTTATSTLTLSGASPPTTSFENPSAIPRRSRDHAPTARRRRQRAPDPRPNPATGNEPAAPAADRFAESDRPRRRHAANRCGRSPSITTATPRTPTSSTPSRPTSGIAHPSRIRPGQRVVLPATYQHRRTARPSGERCRRANANDHTSTDRRTYNSNAPTVIDPRCADSVAGPVAAACPAPQHAGPDARARLHSTPTRPPPSPHQAITRRRHQT